jgi:HEAT repeat protein
MKWFEIRSFIIGVFLSSLGWWLWYNNRTRIKEVKKVVTQKSKAVEKQDLTGVDKLIRGELFHQTQTKHIANKLFPLNSIFVEPEILAYPFSEAAEMGDPPIIDQMIPYLPDASILSGAFDLQGIHPLSMLHSPENIVLVGELGTGKSTLFASLAQKILQNKTRMNRFEGVLPFMIHVSDIDTDRNVEDDIELSFFSNFTFNFPGVLRKRIQRVLTAYLKARKLVLLIDGLDELHPDEVERICSLIKRVLAKYPGVKILVNASPDFLGPLTKMNFYPMVLKGWDIRKREALLSRWLTAWNQNFDENKFGDLGTIIGNWVRKDNRTTTPFAWTLKIWGLLSSDAIGNSEISDIESLYRRLTDERVSHKAIEALAGEFIHQQKIALPQNTLEMLLLRNKFRLSPSTSAAEVLEMTEDNTTTEKKKGGKSGAANASILSTLLDNGFLEINNFGSYYFSHPILLSYFAGYKLVNKEPDINELLRWPVGARAFGYAASFQSELPWLEQILQLNQKDDPLFSQLRLLNGWLSYAPKVHPWRNQLLKQTITILQNDQVPIPLRFRLLAALIAIDDSTIAKLFMRLLAAKSPQVRQLAVFGCGALHEKAASKSLVSHLNDPSDIVAYASMISLSYLQQAEVPQLLHDFLTQSPDEALRRTAAESLARLNPTGLDILKRLAKSEDLIPRRAVVFGLAAVRQRWSHELLETISLEDPEWFVRTTAERVLDDQTDLNFSVPRPNTNYLESDWLLTFAAEKGMGLSPEVYPVELLITALKDKDTDIQWNALNYLRGINEPEVTREFSRLYFSKDTSIGTVQAVDYNLWLKQVSSRPTPG